jgi:Papain family cysteine protease
MRIFWAILAATLVSMSFVAGGAVQDAPGAQNVKKLKYARGLKKIAPDVAAQLHAASNARNARKLKALPKVTAPAYDLTTIGLGPIIIDQGQCGSCWDFSGCVTCTGAFLKAGWATTFASTTLSPQMVLDCGSNGGCNGDDNTTVLAQCQATGLATSSTYGAYQGGPARCNTSPGTLYKITNWGYVSTGNNQAVAATQDIKNALVAYGVIGCGIDADVLGDGTGIITGGGSNIDHDVAIVGWDDTKGAGGCWKMQNSWGTSWGNAGYCWIQYGSGSIGWEAVFAQAPPAVDPPPGPTPPPNPPGPTPVPPGPGTIATFQLNGTGTTLDSVTFELAKTGTQTTLATTIAQLQAQMMTPPAPPVPPVPPSPVDDLTRRVSALEKGIGQILDLLEGKKK